MNMLSITKIEYAHVQVHSYRKSLENDDLPKKFPVDEIPTRDLALRMA